MKTHRAMGMENYALETVQATTESRFKDRKMETVFISPEETASNTERLVVVDPLDSADPTEAMLKAEIFDATDPDDAMLISIIKHPGFQRLWQIEQLTMPKRFATCPEGANWPVAEHALGCLISARRFGGTIEQQLNALLHDYQKTAFGHLGECTIQGFGKENHHDLILLEGLERDRVTDIVHAYGYDIETVFNSGSSFVDCPRPAVDNDRFDYVTREGARRTCPDKVDHIRGSAVIYEDRIVFTNYKAALEFGRDTLRHPLQNWNSDENALKEMFLYGILMHGLENGTLSVENIEKGTDQEVLNKLSSAGDILVDTILNLLEEPFQYSTHNIANIYQFSLNAIPMRIPRFKARYSDPEFFDKTGHLRRLSEADEDFSQLLTEYQNWASQERFLEFYPPAWVPEEMYEQLALLTQERSLVV